MIDLHNHILPGVDDGARDLAESVAIARQFLSEGVTRIAATPHVNPLRGTGPVAEQVETMVEQVAAALAADGIALEVLAASEIFLTPAVPALLRSRAVATLGGGPAALVELPFDHRPLYLEDTLLKMTLDGYQPVVAHPERSWLSRNIDVAADLANRGIVFQLTAPSLLGEYGGAVRRAAEGMLRRGVYAVAASDRHHPDQQRSLAALHTRITEMVGAPAADLLLSENPARLLAGQQVGRPELDEAKQDSFLTRFFAGS